MRALTRKRTRQALSAALFAGIVLASSGVLIVLEAESADADSPVPVVIQSPASGTFSYSSFTTFSGIATPGETITLTTSQGLNCNATADATDAWSCAVNGLTTSPAITATATGNLTDSPPNQSVVTFALIDVPWINGTTFQRITSTDPQPNLTGTGDPGAQVNVSVNSSGCSATVDVSGNWSCTLAPPLPDAAQYGDSLYGMLANQTPTWAGGRTSNYIADTYLLQHPLPDPTFSVPVDTSGGVATAHLTNPVPTVTGTAQPGANVTVTYGLNGLPSSGDFCDTIADGSGSFSCVFDGGTPMTVGNEYYVRAEQIDGVHPGNLGATNLFYIDIINPPTVPTVTAPAGGYTSSEPSVSVSGTADVGDTVQVSSDGVGVCSVVATSGSWTCDTTALAVGPHALAAFASDPYGNSSAASGNVGVVILAPPVAPTLSSPTNGYQSSQPEVTAAGTGVDGYSIHVTVDGADVCSAVAAGGTWTCDLGPLAPGAHAIDAFARDSYGTASGLAGSRAITILDPPAPPTITSPTYIYESSKTSVTVTGTSTTGATVEVFVDGEPECNASVSAGQWSCRVSGLTAAPHWVSAIATDADGSSSSQSEAVFITILAPPSAPLIESPAAGLKSTKGTPVISGTSDGVSVTVHIDGATACVATVGAGGNWSCTSAKLALGLHSISAVAKDSYDTNSSGSRAQSYTVIAPAGAVTPSVVIPEPTPSPTPTPTATPTPDPVPVPSNGKLAITGNAKPHTATAPPVSTVDTPTTFSTTLPSITATKITPLGAAVSGGVAGGFILLVAFPSELLKNTIRENYETAFRWLTPTRRWFAGIAKRAKRIRVNPWLGGSVIILLAAVLLGLATPDFGFNGSSIRLWIALVLSLAAVNLIVPAITGIVSRRTFAAPISLRPLPAALLLVLGSALISRVGHIEPGFLYAGVIGVAFGAKLNRRSNGILALVAVGATVALGLAAWLGYSAIAPLAEQHPSFWNLLWSEALSALTIEALATLVISLLPLRFLDGASLFAWKKWVWAVAYFTALIILIFVIAPISNNWGPETAPLFGWGVFFILFALVAVGIWALFRLRAGGEERGEEPGE